MTRHSYIVLGSSREENSLCRVQETHSSRLEILLLFENMSPQASDRDCLQGGDGWEGMSWSRLAAKGLQPDLGCLFSLL